jgi:hypothetical protein
MSTTSVDVFVNVANKPLQTALTLLSLERHSGKRIGRIWFINEPMDASDHSLIWTRLGHKMTYYRPRYYFGVDPVNEEDTRDEEFRHSIRYQFAWEHSDKEHVFITHNDVHYTGDIIGAMLEAAQGHVAVGQIGQCGGCPARAEELCGPGRYLDFKPTYRQLVDIYEKASPKTRPYHKPGFDREFRMNPWPLPLCRVNEWSALLNLKIARKATQPWGPARYFGAFYNSGLATLDTGVGWFRDISIMGLTSSHFPVQDFSRHFVGHPSMLEKQRYVQNELKARDILEQEFGIQVDSNGEDGWFSLAPATSSRK